MVHWPAAWTLNLSTPDAPVTSVLLDPDAAMSFGKPSAVALESVAVMAKLVPPPIVGSTFPEYDQLTMSVIQNPM
jgi:hypothetical protein